MLRRIFVIEWVFFSLSKTVYTFVEVYEFEGVECVSFSVIHQILLKFKSLVLLPEKENKFFFSVHCLLV